MPVTNPQTGTRIDEVADRIYRISTPVPPSVAPGGFSFNQYLVADDEPLLFHTGPRRIFPQVREAVKTVLPLSRLRHLAFSHFESDECGSVNLLLAAAPGAAPVCGQVNALINADAWDRPPRALADGELLPLGHHAVRWLDTPHLPHTWECGYLMEESTRTLLCGDLFTQGGADLPPLTGSDILGPSEAMRARLDYFSHTSRAAALLERLASCAPTTLACMHGSAWEGDGAGLLQALARALGGGDAVPERGAADAQDGPEAPSDRASAAAPAPAPLAAVSCRPASPDDADEIARIYNDGIEDRSATFETRPRTAAEVVAWLAKPVVVADVPGAVLGWAALSATSARPCYAGVLELSIYVDRAARGRGVGLALGEAILAAAQDASAWKVVGKLFPENQASASLVRALGFREVGVHHRHARLDGSWRDVLLVEKLVGEAAREP